MKLNNLYTTSEIEEYHKAHENHHEYTFGHNPSINKMFIRFGNFEFIKDEDKFLCVRNLEDGWIDEEKNKDKTEVFLPSNRKTASYWTRHNKSNLEAKRHGYQQNG